MARAFATVNRSDAALFAPLARAAEQRLGKFSPQGLAFTARAFAMADRSDALVFASLGRAAERRLGKLNP